MDDKFDRVATLLKTVAHPTRIEIIQMLSKTPQMNVSDIVEQLQVEQSLTSHHLIKMKDRGVLTQTRKQKNIYYALANPAFAEIIQQVFDNPLVRSAN